MLETEESFVSTVDLVQESLKTFYKNELENLENVYNAINTTLVGLQETAENSTVDVSGCFTSSDVISSLFKITSTSIGNCINEGIQSCINLLSSSLYLVNIAYNQVQAIRYQLDLCKADEQDCVQSVLDNIASSLVDLPELIRINIEDFQDTLVLLQKSSKTCASSSLEMFILSSNTTISDISQCIDNANQQ